MKKLMIFAVMTALLITAGLAYADVTGDFKVASATYTGDEFGGDVKVNGTVNHGAIQSGKSVVVNVSYTYSFEYTMTTEAITTKTVYCPNEHSNDDACRDQKSKNIDTPRVITTVVTSTKTFDATGMVAVTEPTVDSKGRLNPKGKVTGYDWVNNVSIVASNVVVDPGLIPDGATFVDGSVKIKTVSFTAFLKDKLGLSIADTLVSGDIFP